MQLIKLTKPTGTPIWINPAHVLYLEPAAEVVARTIVRFALLPMGQYHSEDPYCERVKETPELVAALLADPSLDYEDSAAVAS